MEFRIWVMGGRRSIIEPKGIRDEYRNTGEDEVSPTLECYDPKTNTWEYKAPMPSPRFLFGAVVAPDDRIFVFGGHPIMPGEEGKSALDNTEIYDPKTDTWSMGTPLPGTRCGHSAVLGANKKIYLLGGVIDFRNPPLREVWIYDPVKDSFKNGPNMKLPRSSLAAVATPDGKIYAIGGTDVGAYKGRNAINEFLPRKLRLYAGGVQDTVEVLDIFE